MPTQQPVMWAVMQQNMEPGRWYSNQEIYDIVSRHVELEKDDWDPAVTNRSDPRWQRNVRNIFQYRKKTDELLWSGHGQYMIPITKDSIAQSASTSTGTELSEEQFNILQERRRETGIEGEEYIVQIEKNRLRRAGRSDLAERVFRVSITNIGAGYDIASFDDGGTPRHIEVKATRTSRHAFEITQNELHTARKFGSQYWIYFVFDLGGKNRLVTFQDPASLIGSKIELEPIAYIARIK